MTIAPISARITGSGILNSFLVQNRPASRKLLAVANISGNGVLSETSRMKATLTGQGGVELASSMMSANLSGQGYFNGLTAFPPTQTPLDLNSVQEEFQYQIDLERIIEILFRSIAFEQMIDETNVFLNIIALALTIQRYYIRHMGDQLDIDQTSYLDQIQAEVGAGLPVTDSIPMVELIRENKSWYNRKGTVSLYDFIGDLCGSPIEIDFPEELILRTSTPRTCLSGAVTTHGGLLPFAESKLGRIRDGIYWARFDYVVKVLQAQNIVNFQDFYTLLESIHPVGLKEFIEFDFNYISPQSALTPTILLESEVIDDNLINSPKYPTLDNNFLLDNTNSGLSMHGGTIKDNYVSVVEIPVLEMDSPIQRMSSDQYTHKYLADVGPWAGFSRLVKQSSIGRMSATLQGKGYCETSHSNLSANIVGSGGVSNTSPYYEVFSDSDAIVYENVTTNVGISQYTYGDLAPYSYRALKDAAWNNDQNNMRGMWLQQGLEEVLQILAPGHTLSFFGGAGSVSANLSALHKGQASLVGGASISANINGDHTMSSTISGNSALAGSIRSGARLHSSITGTGSVSIASLHGNQSMAYIVGHSSLTASPRMYGHDTGTGTVRANLQGAHKDSASLSGSGSVSASLHGIQSHANLTGHSTINAFLTGQGGIYSYNNMVGNSRVNVSMSYTKTILVGHGSMRANLRSVANHITGSGTMQAKLTSLHANLSGSGKMSNAKIGHS